MSSWTTTANLIGKGTASACWARSPYPPCPNSSVRNISCIFTVHKHRGFSFLCSCSFFPVKTSDSSSGEPLLSQVYLDVCKEMFSVPSGALCARPLTLFTPKHLNIIDPLKESNNLGRSISKGDHLLNLFLPSSMC